MEKIVLLIDNKPHREQVQKQLSTRYEIITGTPGLVLENHFDLCIIDILNLEKHKYALFEHKDRDKPLFTPVLGIIERSDIQYLQTYQGTIVDEIITTPLLPDEVQLRVDNLIRTAGFSRELYRHTKSGQDKTPDFLQLAKRSPDMIYRIGLPEGKYEYVSGAAENVYGYTVEDFYQNPFLIKDIIDPQWRDYFDEQWDSLLKGEVPQTYEYPIRDKKGKKRWINQRNVLIKNQTGHPVALEGVCTDISERKKAEEALRERVLLNNRISKLLPIVLYIWEIPTMRAVYVNREVDLALGYSSEQVQRMHGDFIPNIMHPEDIPRFKQHMHQISTLPDGTILELEYRMRSPDGQWLWFLSRDSVFERDENGTPTKVIGAATDITDRKKSEEELRRSEERFRLAQHLSGIGTWEWKIDSNTVFWSDTAIRMWGYAPEEFGGALDDVSRRIHPDDLERWREDVRDCLEQGKEHRLDYRVVLPQATIRWVAVYGNAERDQRGEAYRMAGVVMDITERKMAEEELKISRERFKSLMCHTSEGFYLCEMPEPISVNSPASEQIRLLYKAVIVECNDAQARFFGYESADDVLGKPLSVIRGGEDIPENVDFLRDWINNEYNISGAASKEPDKQGNERWFSKSVVGIIEQGKLLRVWGSQIDITQMKNAEEELKKERNLSNKIVDSLPGMFYLFDQKGKFLRWNRLFEEIGGYSSEDLSNLHPLDLFRGSDRELVASRINRVFETGKADVEASFYTKDGREIPCFFSGRLIDLDRRPVLIGMGLDISQRKRAEEQLRESEEKLRLFIEHAPAALAMFDRQMRYLAVSRRWRTDYKLGNRHILGKSHYEIFPEIPDHWKRSHERAMRGEIVRTENDPVTRITGEVQWIQWEVRPWYTSKGDIGGVLLLTEDVTRRRQAQQALRASEENLRTTLNSIGDAVIATDTHGMITTINQVAAHLTGWDADKARGKPLKDVFRIVDSQTRKSSEDPVNRVLSTEKIVGPANHTLLISRSGKEYQIADSGAPIRDTQGTVIGVVLVFRDVTREYTMREKIAANEERFRIISELTSDFSTGFKQMPDGAMEMEWSLGPIEKISGYSIEELTSIGGLFGIIHPDDMQESRANTLRIKEEEGYSYTHDVRITTKDGRERWLRNFGTSRRNRNGELRFYLAAQDITNRKQAAEQLRQKEEQLRLAMEIARLAYFEYDPQAGHAHRYGYYRLLGVSDALTGLDTSSFFQRYIYPDDLPLVKKTFDEAMISHVELDLEFRMQRPDGRLIWVASRVNANRDKSGRLKNIIGVALDITERKQAEAALAAEKERLAVTLRSIGDGVITTDIAGRILMINRAGEQLTGWSQETAAGKPLPEILNIAEGNSPQIKINPAETVLQRKEVIMLPDDTVLSKADGSEISISDSSAPILDMSGAILGVVLVFRDITERKNYEANLHASLHQKEVLLQELYHRTKNNMQVISSLLELQAASSSSDEVEKIVRESKTRIRTMSLAHEKLYKSKNLSLIKMKDYIVDLAQLLMSGYGATEDRIKINFDIEDISLLIDLAIPCGLIISELLSNSLKYAFPQEREGRIDIGLAKIADKQMRLRVRDNGVGVPQGVDIMKSRTLGVQLILQIVKHQLHGFYEIITDGGIGWSITFRKDLYSERV